MHTLSKVHVRKGESTSPSLFDLDKSAEDWKDRGGWEVDPAVTKPLLRKEEDTLVKKDVAVLKLAIRALDNAIE